MEEEIRKCIFGIYKDDILIGHRTDTFGSLSKTWAKVYGYTQSQVEIIRKNVKAETNYAGTGLMKVLAGMNNVAVNASTGESVAMSSAVNQVFRQEGALRELEKFELRVYELPVTQEEWYEIDSTEQWKRDKILSNLGEPLEVFKYEILKDEN